MMILSGLEDAAIIRRVPKDTAKEEIREMLAASWRASPECFQATSPLPLLDLPHFYLNTGRLTSHWHLQVPKSSLHLVHSTGT